MNASDPPIASPASATACRRVAAPSFAIAARTCDSTVDLDSRNTAAISFDEEPLATSARTSAWREESASRSRFANSWRVLRRHNSAEATLPTPETYSTTGLIW